MDLNFEQMLAQHNQEFKEAEVFSSWMPPDGDYIVSLIKLDSGSSSKDGVDLVWWKLKGRIEDVQDEKLNGREFTVGYYTSKVFGILKGAVKTLAGEVVNDLAEAHNVLALAVNTGTIIRAKVETSTSRKNGKDYTNCYIQEVINTETAATGVETPDGIYIPPVEAAQEGQTPVEAPAEAPPVV